jgi:membrane AbrB-like protein
MAPKKNKPYTRSDFAGEAFTVAVGAIGGLAFVLLHIPGGAMSGSVVAVAILSIFGLAHGVSAPLRYLAMGIIGTAIGSVVGPDTFAHIAAYPASIALMATCVVLMTLASTAVWVWLMGWPRSMALLASVPGSMSYIVSVSMSMGADAARIAVVQMSRVIFLATMLPFFIVHEVGNPLTALAAMTLDPPEMVMLSLAAGFTVGGLFAWYNISGGMILGAMVASGALHFFGIAPGRSPAWLMSGGQLLLGAWVGSRFVDFDWTLFARICLGTVLALGAMLAVSLLFSNVATTLLGVPFGAALIGYAPGSQEVMVVLALTLGVDPIFVAAHHLARYFFISMCLPFLVAWMRKSEGRSEV